MTPYYQDALVTLYHGDCRDVITRIPTVTAVVSDPPYGMNYKPLRGADGSKRWDGVVAGDDADFDPAFLMALGVPVVLWGANWYSHRIEGHGGWLVWNKTPDHRKVGFVSSDCELAFASGATRIHRFDLQWGGEARNGEPIYHPTQKPRALMAWCLQFVPAHGVVLDPYCGAGPTLEACKLVGREAIGIEIEEVHCETAARRLSQGTLAEMFQ